MEEKSKFTIIQVPNEEAENLLNSLGKKTEISQDSRCAEVVKTNWRTGTGCYCHADGYYACSDSDVWV